MLTELFEIFVGDGVRHLGDRLRDTQHDAFGIRENRARLVFPDRLDLLGRHVRYYGVFASMGRAVLAACRYADDVGRKPFQIL